VAEGAGVGDGDGDGVGDGFDELHATRTSDTARMKVARTAGRR
jgi:hypothetical protein